MKIRGIVFDMDGVLIDAREWHYIALNRILDQFGLAISREEHLLEFDGLPTKDKLQRLSQRYGLPVSLHDFVNEMKQIYTTQLIHNNCWPVFQHQRALAELKRQGYHLAVASNSIRTSIETMLGRAHLLSYLDFYLSNEDVPKGKPDPEIYSTAFSRLGLLPHECLVVEDNVHGITAAKGAGAHVFVVNDPSDVTLENIQMSINKYEKEGL